LRRRDLPWLGLIILFGGVLGPALLMVGLTSVSGGAGSLLLNTESLATMAIAWIFFRENVDRRVFAGAMALLAGALVLSSRRCGDDCRLGRCADRRGLRLLGHRRKTLAYRHDVNHNCITEEPMETRNLLEVA
jgi:hypothetical protein